MFEILKYIIYFPFLESISARNLKLTRVLHLQCAKYSLRNEQIEPSNSPFMSCHYQ